MGTEQKQPSTHSLIKQIKQANQDFEWYPTTDEILATIKADIDSMIGEREIEGHPTILDCGAGDGRSLMYLTEGKRYAIEIARPLLHAMDSSIYVIGADFHQQTLMDKCLEITFSNPPYSQFVAWSTKIIRESRSGYIYLVIPQRWKDNDEIKSAFELREAKAEVIGNFDFLDADRAALAVVDLVKINLAGKSRSRLDSSSKTDPFEIWFDESFKIKTDKKSDYETSSAKISKEKVQSELVKGNDITTVLTALYDRDLQHLIKNYKALELLDPSILNELDISFSGLREALSIKIKGLKNVYWNELFNNLQKITDKLTKGSRKNLLNTLTARTDVDFNAGNIYAVVIWVIKNANVYYDKQLIDLAKSMVEKANVVLYKSNKKTLGDEAWRYCRRPDDLERFTLDYRVILERMGGLANSSFSWERTRHAGLSDRAHFFILDILTVATNIGFDTTNKTRPSDFEWLSNKGNDFYYYDYSKKKDVILMSVKAFKNGNLHCKFNQKFIMRLNVEFGRLKGWVKNAQEAAEEMDIDVSDAMGSFNTNLKLTSDNLVQLGFQEAA